MNSGAVSILKRNPLFTALPLAEINSLLDGHDLRQLTEGDTLFHHGDAARSLFLILEGEVILLAAGCTETLLPMMHLTTGETVGEEAVLTGMPHCATARAVSNATIIAIPAASLMTYLEHHFQVAITMISNMAAHLREQVKEITELKMQSTAERLASFLLGLAGAGSGRIVVRLPYEKRLLADHLGMDPATLSRAFAKLRDKGVVASRTDKVEIADIERLRRYGDGTAITG
jgi:CRP/FNR family transcriptional activator FtrB